MPPLRTHRRLVYMPKNMTTPSNIAGKSQFWIDKFSFLRHGQFFHIEQLTGRLRGSHKIPSTKASGAARRPWAHSHGSGGGTDPQLQQLVAVENFIPGMKFHKYLLFLDIVYMHVSFIYTHMYLRMRMYIYMCVCVCVCMYVCNIM